MINHNITPFQYVYDRFLSKITDDLYLELTPEDTYRDLQSILLNSIPGFEFPRFPLFDYNLNEFIERVDSPGAFNSVLTHEEVEIISDLMVIEWVRRQIASVENTRMKYSGSDFKFTSQANHLDKLIRLKKDMESGSKHKQRLYKRRKIDSDTGRVSTNWSGMAGGVINGTRNKV